MVTSRNLPFKPWAWILALGALAALVLVSQWNYLVYHSLAEFFSVAVAAGLFLLAWNARRFGVSDFFLFIATAYMLVAFIDALHTLAYSGMGVFPTHGTNLPTQLWIAARGLQAAALLAGPAFLARRVPLAPAVGGLVGITGLLLLSIFAWDIFPVCHVQGEGLTPFKIVSEYVIVLALVGAGVHLWMHRQRLDESVWRLMIAAIAVTILSEAAFMAYRGVYGPMNLIGHLLKIVAFFLVYKAVISTGLRRPYDLLFRDLQASERSLREARDGLERTVEERTAELRRTVEALQVENEDRRRAEHQRDAERRRLTALLDLLPAYVKMVDDQHQIRYVNRHYRDLFGAPGERPCHEIQHGMMCPCEHCGIGQIIETQRSAEWEWTDAHGRTYHVIGHPFPDFDGTEAVLVLGMDISRSKQLERQVIEAGEYERRNVGRDLHDSLGQKLAGLSYMVQSFSHRLQGQSETGDEMGRRLNELLRDAVTEMRALAKGLDPVGIEGQNLLAPLRELAERLEAAYGISCRFTGTEDIVRLPDDVATHLYRIAQEAASNAMRHSGAQNVWIRLEQVADRLQLWIEDDGGGIAPSDGDGEGMGMRTMRYRAGVIGATFSIRSRLQGGTTVACSLCAPQPHKQKVLP